MNRRAHRPVVLPLALVLAAGGVAVSVAPVGATLAAIHPGSAAAGQLHIAGIPFSYPRLNGAAWILFSLALVGASAIAIALQAALRQRTAYRRFLARLDIVGQLSERPRVLVIADPHPQAFCAGYLRPTVYISQAAVDLLSDAELEAVLEHEHHHRRLRDPLCLACGRIFSQALFFVPALRALFHRYADLAELNADAAAVRAGTGGRAALASALLRFEASGAGISPDRVDSLLGHPVVWRRPWWRLTASLGVLSTFITVTLGASQGASARATFNLPLLSSRPCLAMLTALPLLGFLAIVGRRAVASRASHSQ